MESLLTISRLSSGLGSFLAMSTRALAFCSNQEIDDPLLDRGVLYCSVKGDEAVGALLVAHEAEGMDGGAAEFRVLFGAGDFEEPGGIAGHEHGFDNGFAFDACLVKLPEFILGMQNGEVADGFNAEACILLIAGDGEEFVGGARDHPAGDGLVFKRLVLAGTVDCDKFGADVFVARHGQVAQGAHLEVGVGARLGCGEQKLVGLRRFVLREDEESAVFEARGRSGFQEVCEERHGAFGIAVHEAVERHEFDVFIGFDGGGVDGLPRPAVGFRRQAPGRHSAIRWKGTADEETRGWPGLHRDGRDGSRRKLNRGHHRSGRFCAGQFRRTARGHRPSVRRRQLRRASSSLRPGAATSSKVPCWPGCSPTRPANPARCPWSRTRCGKPGAVAAATGSPSPATTRRAVSSTRSRRPPSRSTPNWTPRRRPSRATVPAAHRARRRHRGHQAPDHPPRTGR